MNETSKKTLSLDFDGVCHQYTSPWQGPTVIPDPPVEGLFPFLVEATKYFIVEIYSTRSETYQGRKAMQDWFDIQCGKYTDGLVPDDAEEVYDAVQALRFPTSKPKAFVGLDDRILTFEGTWPKMETLVTWRPWNKRGVNVTNSAAFQLPIRFNRDDFLMVREMLRAKVFPYYKSDERPSSVTFEQDCARRIYNQLRDVKL